MVYVKDIFSTPSLCSEKSLNVTEIQSAWDVPVTMDFSVVDAIVKSFFTSFISDRY